jgi:hypothetical protein
MGACGVSPQKIEILFKAFLYLINKMNTTIITVSREYDKLCLLEQILKDNNLQPLEPIISQLIDALISNNQCDINKYLEILKEHDIEKIDVINAIIEFSISIANDFPILFTIQVNEKTKKYIEYINKSDILPLF